MTMDLSNRLIYIILCIDSLKFLNPLYVICIILICLFPSLHNLETWTSRKGSLSVRRLTQCPSTCLQVGVTDWKSPRWRWSYPPSVSGSVVHLVSIMGFSPISLYVNWHSIFSVITPVLSACTVPICVCLFVSVGTIFTDYCRVLFFRVTVSDS